MALAKIREVDGKIVPVVGDDIDTDRIIPARFMKCVTFDGLGAYAFHDVRFDESGKPKGHPIDDPAHAGATILLSGRNFGCGSSREHAPQSLYYHGFRAIVAESFAEIFFGNATTLGMPCLALSGSDVRELARLVRESPSTVARIDVASATLRFGDRKFTGDIPQGVRDDLVDGRWDSLALLLEGKKEVAALAETLP